MTASDPLPVPTPGASSEPAPQGSGSDEGARNDQTEKTAPVSQSATGAEDQSGLSNREREKLELRLLTAEASLMEISAKEAGQRHLIRWIAVLTGLVVIVVMFSLVGHALHRINWWPVFRPSTAFMIVIVVGPVASITTITIALFIGAFRKFEDKDTERAADGVTTGLNWFRGS